MRANNRRRRLSIHTAAGTDQFIGTAYDMRVRPVSQDLRDCGVTKADSEKVWGFSVSSRHVGIGSVLEKEFGGGCITVPHCQVVQWTVVAGVGPVRVDAPFDQQFPDQYVEILIRCLRGRVNIFRRQRLVFSCFP
jgi:hypothetical protein